MAEPEPHDYLASMKERSEAHRVLARHDVDVKHVYRVVSAGDSDLFHEGERREAVYYVASDGTPCVALAVGPEQFVISSGW